MTTVTPATPRHRQRILGLDLGPTSIGWAYVEAPDFDTGEAGRVIGAGVRTFPEGVDRTPQGAEQSKSQARRVARGMRRQTRRRRRRKMMLRDGLREAGLLPRGDDELEQLLARDPYELRARALDERLEPFEIGRAILHLASRRGFLSNRRTDAGADDRGTVLESIGALREEMAESGSRTVGEHLHRLQHAGSERFPRLRGRYLHRAMLEEELDLIWSAQQRHHHGLLTDVLLDGHGGRVRYPAPPIRHHRHMTPLQQFGVRGLVFFQRPLRVDDAKVGSCPLQPHNPRCERADRLAQRFRLLTEVNNLRIIDLDAPNAPARALTEDERAKLIDYLQLTRKRTFEQIKKKLKLHPDRFVFNFESGGLRTDLKGMETDAILAAKPDAKRPGLGKERWLALDDSIKNRIVRLLVSRRSDADVLDALQRECGLDADEAARILNAPLPSGRMAYSLRAIRKLLPHLEHGLPLTAQTGTENAMHAAGYRRADEQRVDMVEQLPPPPDMPNPVVRAAMHQVRTVVNAIVREWGPPDVVRVELPREMRQSQEERAKAATDMRKRQQLREAVKEQIEELGFKATGDAIDRWLLWQEQGEVCIYSGRPISARQLLDPQGEIDIDHIIPRWRSLDDSLANKIVCFASENRDKRDRTVGEWLADSDPDRFERIQQLARLHGVQRNKRRKLAMKDAPVDEFIARQLVDTSYLSREVVAYLRHICSDVSVTRGRLTGELRRAWNLNTIIDPAGRGEKNRADHRHHAIDAFIVAATDRSALQRLSTMHRGKWKQRHGEAPREELHMPAPWPGFRDMVAKAVEQIVVSNKPNRRIAGALHEATVFGKLADGAYVRRKPVEEIKTAKRLAKVRDEGTRRSLEAHLRARGVDPQAGSFPNGVFEGENAPRKLRRDGTPGPIIRSVRMQENVSDPRPRGTGYVKSGNNHHVSFFVPVEGTGRWKARVTTVWDVAERVRQNENENENDGPLPPVDRTPPDGYRFLCSLAKGECFSVLDPDDPDSGRRRVFVVRKLERRGDSPNDLQKVHYRDTTDARDEATLAPENLYFSCKRLAELDMCKVSVDPIGRVRTAKD